MSLNVSKLYAQQNKYRVNYLLLIQGIISRYMVDAADHEKLEASRNELHGLLEKPQLAGIPVSNMQDVLVPLFCSLYWTFQQDKNTER